MDTANQTSMSSRRMVEKTVDDVDESAQRSMQQMKLPGPLFRADSSEKRWEAPLARFCAPTARRSLAGGLGARQRAGRTQQCVVC